MSLEDVTTSAPAPAADTPASPTPAQSEAPANDAPKDEGQGSETALEDDLRKVFRNRNLPRGERGKFAAKDGKPAPVIEGQAAELAEGETPAEQPKAEDPPQPVVPAPRSWAKDAAEEWAKIPPKAQQYIAQREAEVHRYISQVGQQVKQFEPIRSVLEQNRAVFERNGADFANGVQALLAAQDMLDRNPVNGIANLAQMYGVDLRALAAQMYGQDSMTGLPPDPEVSALQLKLKQMEQQLQFQEQERTARERSAAQAREMQIRASFESAIDSFAKDKADFDEVAPDILANIYSIQQTSPGLSPEQVLQTAYERAIWANPKTRDAQMKAQEARRLQEAAKTAEQAKRAGSINVRGAPKQQSSVGEDLDADLRAVFRRSRDRS